MIALGIKAPDRDTIIQFLRDRGVIIDYAPEVTEDVPDTWAVKLAATFDKEPTADDIAAAMEKVLIPAHTRVIEPERMSFDSGVLDTDCLVRKADLFRRTLTAAVVDKNGDVTTPAVLDDPIVKVRFKDDEGGLRLAAQLDKGGTMNNNLKLAARAEDKADALQKGETLVIKGGRSRAIPAYTSTWTRFDAEGAVEEYAVDIGAVTVFQIGGENGVDPDQLGRKFLGE